MRIAYASKRLKFHVAFNEQDEEDEAGVMVDNSGGQFELADSPDAAPEGDTFGFSPVSNG